jgi:hypothetical protein
MRNAELDIFRRGGTGCPSERARFVRTSWRKLEGIAQTPIVFLVVYASAFLSFKFVMFSCEYAEAKRCFIVSGIEEGNVSWYRSSGGVAGKWMAKRLSWFTEIGSVYESCYEWTIRAARGAT